MIHRLSSKFAPGMTAVALTMVTSSLSTISAGEGDRSIGELVALGDEAYVDNRVPEAVRYYRRAHDLLPGSNADEAMKAAVNERYLKSLKMADIGGQPVLVGAVASDTQQRTVARLDERVQQAMTHVDKARRLYADKKYEQALAEYQAALDILPEAPVTEKKRKFIVLSHADASVAVAKEYAGVGRYDEARTLLDNALKVDPGNKFALRALTLLNDPVRNNPAKTPQHVANVDEVNRLLNLGWGYYDLGLYDDSIKGFEAVLRIDPANTVARRGMERVHRRKSSYHNASYDEMRSAALAEVVEGWSTPPQPEENIDPGDAPDSDPLVLQRRTIDDKLRSIVIPQINFESVDLMDAVSFLRRQAQTLGQGETAADRGINIVVNLGDPDSEEARNILSKKFDLRMNNVPMGEVLQYIARVTGTVTYTTPYSVEIGTNTGSEPLSSRVLIIPPGFFSNVSTGSSASEEPDPFADTSSSSGLSIKRIDPVEALKTMGVPFPEGAMAQYNGQNSSLVIRNTPANIRLVEQLIAASAAEQPAQVMVSATIIEVSEETLKELGFDWIVNLNFDVNKWYGSGGDRLDGSTSGQPDITGVARSTSGLMSAGLRMSSDVMTTDSIDALIRTGPNGQVQGYAPGKAPSIFSVRGVWTAADVTMIMRGLDQKKGADILQKPSTIVRPGQKATFFAGRELPYPEEYEPPQIPTNGGGSSGNEGGMIVAPSHPASFVTRQIGTVFDVEVTGINDSKTGMTLSINPQIVEFDGFINYGSPITVPMVAYDSADLMSRQGDIENVEVSRNEILKPVFTTRSVATSVNIESGQTIVIGGLKKARTMEFEDKIPIFGDIPLVGRFFRSSGKQVQRQALLIFVKAEIIDPAGRDIATNVRNSYEKASLEGGLIAPSDISEPAPTPQPDDLVP